MEAEEVRIQLLETFMPDDAIFGQESMLHLDHSHRVAHSKESLSFDTVSSSSSSMLHILMPYFYISTND